MQKHIGHAVHCTLHKKNKFTNIVLYCFVAHTPARLCFFLTGDAAEGVDAITLKTKSTPGGCGTNKDHEHRDEHACAF